MTDNQKNRQAAVAGSRYQSLTLETLPPPETRKWMPRLKAQVVAAVKGRLLTVEEACHRYGLSLEEFVSWQRAFDHLELVGWQVARMQHYRELHDRQHLNDVHPNAGRPGRKKKLT